MLLPTKQQWAAMLPSAKLRVIAAHLCSICRYHDCYDGSVCPYDAMSDEERHNVWVNFKQILDDEEE